MYDRSSTGRGIRVEARVEITSAMRVKVRVALNTATNRWLREVQGPAFCLIADSYGFSTELHHAYSSSSMHHPSHKKATNHDHDSSEPEELKVNTQAETDSNFFFFFFLPKYSNHPTYVVYMYKGYISLHILELILNQLLNSGSQSSRFSISNRLINSIANE